MRWLCSLFAVTAIMLTSIVKADYHFNPDKPTSCRPWTLTWDSSDERPQNIVMYLVPQFNLGSFATTGLIKYTNIQGNSLDLGKLVLPPISDLLVYKNFDTDHKVIYNGTLEAGDDETCYFLVSSQTDVPQIQGNIQLTSDMPNSPLGQCQQTNISWGGYSSAPFLGISGNVNGTEIAVWKLAPWNRSMGSFDPSGYGETVKVPFPAGTAYSLYTYQLFNLEDIAILNDTARVQLGGSNEVGPGGDSSCLLFQPSSNLSNSNPNNGDPPKKSNSHKAIIGAVVGVVGLILLLVGLFLAWKRWGSTARKRRRHTSTILDENEDMNLHAPVSPFLIQQPPRLPPMGQVTGNVSPFQDPEIAVEPLPSNSPPNEGPSVSPNSEISQQHQQPLLATGPSSVPPTSQAATIYHSDGGPVEVPPSYSTIGHGRKQSEPRTKLVALVH